MQDQLCLWPEAESPCQKPNIWEDLSPETRAMVIALLSKLINKAVCPPAEEDASER